MPLLFLHLFDLTICILYCCFIFNYFVNIIIFDNVIKYCRYLCDPVFPWHGPSGAAAGRAGDEEGGRGRGGSGGGNHSRSAGQAAAEGILSEGAQ